jgi:uncharacterized protein (TIGR03032 family)
MSAPPAPEPFVLTTSRGFPEWLAGAGASLAFTTYQAGKLFLLGLKPDGSLSVFERTFARCMGLGVSDDGRSFALATQHAILRFDDVVGPGGRGPSQSIYDGADAVYAPHASWTTGDVDAHDVAFPASGRPVFANTLFSCVGEVSDGHSFRPVWKPPFVSRLAPEDRCHLNGLAMRDGRPRYVTLVGPSDVADGWRAHRGGGGRVYDIDSGDVLADGLSMPHSPRWFDGRLWMLNSGTGELGVVEDGAFRAVAFCPGYARGLAFAGRHAIVGLSLARENKTFSGLALDEALSGRGAEARCGLLVIDTATGDTVAWVRVEGVVRELFDVGVLPGVRRPAMVGLLGDDIRRVVSIDEG